VVRVVTSDTGSGSATVASSEGKFENGS